MRQRPDAKSVVFDAMMAIARDRILALTGNTHHVVTWCRICGHEAILRVPGDYEWALSEFHGIDDQPRVHYGHVETTNWGVHWRLDEVLFMLFPREHREPQWPMSKWWQLEYGEPKEEGRPVEWLSEDELRGRAPSQVEMDRRMLVAQIERSRRCKEELLEISHSVWSHDQMRQDFDVLTFQKPFVIVRMKGTDQIGTLLFQENPRYYYGWRPST